MAYALIAVGYSLVFGILRLINFSHGSIYAFSAHMALLFIGFQFGVIPAIAMSIVLTGLLGVIIDKAALAPLRKRNSIPMAALITTIGMSNIIQNLLMIFFNTERKPFPAFFDFGPIKLGGIQINSTQVVMCVVSLTLLIILTLIINKTKLGLSMRATEQNSKAASLMGINTNFIISFTFFNGRGLGGYRGRAYKRATIRLCTPEWALWSALRLSPRLYLAASECCMAPWLADWWSVCRRASPRPSSVPPTEIQLRSSY